MSQHNSKGPQTAQITLMNQERAKYEQTIKEIVLETLIELNLVPKPQKRKALTNV